jgi:drug/metabolite transporter (DMT)-like permease
MLAAGLCWSTSGILVRSVTLTDAWEVVFWRALFMAIFIGACLIVWHRQHTLTRIVAVGRPGLLAGCLLASTFFFFILSVMQTTVANTLVLMSTAPFVAALFGRTFLGEQVPRRTYVAMAAGLMGIALMFVDALSSGGMIGNLLACGVPLAFGANIVLLRRMGASVDMVPTVLLAGLVAVAVALPMGWPLTASWHDVGVLAVMGVLQLGAGCLLLTLAAPHLSAAEIGLFSLLETTLGPVWVWLGIGERPSDPALLGGVIVVTALLVNEIVGVRSAAGATRRAVRLTGQEQS